PGLRLRYFLVGGNLAMDRLLASLVMDRFELDAALARHVPRRREVLEAVEGGPYHVMRVGRAEALREDVAYAGALEHRAHRASRPPAPPTTTPPPTTSPTPPTAATPATAGPRGRPLFGLPFTPCMRRLWRIRRRRSGRASRPARP